MAATVPRGLLQEWLCRLTNTLKAFAFLDVDRPWIAWLVYRGELISRSAVTEKVLSVWHAGYLLNLGNTRSRRRFGRELEIEAKRERLHPQPISRLSGLYVFEDVEAARTAAQYWGGAFRGEHLAEIELDDSVRFSKHDSEWITRFMEADDGSWIDMYLSGQPTDEPTWELLVEGRGLILGTEVRQRAYETVRNEWPDSLALLELSRVAVELDSDLGFIAPIVTFADGWAELKMYLDFRDATNPEFLDRFARYDGPKNTADLNEQADLVLPDLTPFSTRFEVSARNG